MRISSHSMARWRDLIDVGEMLSDWRSQLHPSARALQAPIPMQSSGTWLIGAPHHDDRSSRREGASGAGNTDLRKGLDGLATLVQEHLKKDPFSGHLLRSGGKSARKLKILFWDGNGLCLFSSRSGPS